MLIFNINIKYRSDTKILIFFTQNLENTWARILVSILILGMYEAPAKSKGQDQSTMNFLRDFMLGGSSGAIAKTLVAPIERVKFLLQIQQSNFSLREKPYKGIIDCFQRCIKQEGLFSLWKGNWNNLFRYFPTQAINFSVNDAINRYLVSGVDPNTQKANYIFKSFLSGGLAGSFSLILVYPLDFAGYRRKMIFAKEGISGFYRGFSVSVLAIFMYRALYFGGYDTGKQFIWGLEEEQKKSAFLARFLFAQIVTLSSVTLVYPLDTIRRNLIMESCKALNKRQYNRVIDCGKNILSTEGVAGFFKGNLRNFWRSIGSSLVLVLYDEMQNMLDKKNHQQIFHQRQVKKRFVLVNNCQN